MVKHVCSQRYPWVTVTIILGLVGESWSCTPPAPKENPLFERLCAEGVRLDSDVTVKLPQPVAAEGLEGDAQLVLLRQVARQGRFEQFIRRSSVAPFTLQQAYIKDDEGNRVGHAVSLWFVAYGLLAQLTDDRLADDFFGRERSTQETDNGRVRELTDKELSHLDNAIDPHRERFVLAEFPLLNRIELRGVGHAQKSESEQSLLIAWELDKRFQDHAQLRAEWRKWQTNNLGQRSLGPPHAYQGYGGYLKITQLQQPAGALLFEAHVVFHEPPDWFSGSNFLRSKTPLLVDENVKKLRRELARIRQESER